MFSFLAWFCSLPQTGNALVLISVVINVTNAMASKRPKKGKIQFPVAVRGSKTSLLLSSLIAVNRATLVDVVL